MKKSLLAFPLALVFLLGACAAHRPITLVNPFPPVRSIAVLPMNNDTVNFEGADIVRKEIARMLSAKGYRVLPLDALDAKLKSDFSITDGGQLPSVDPQALGKGLGVDALLYGELEEFGIQNVGFYINRRVKAHATLINPVDRSVIWEDEGGFSKKIIATNVEDAKKAFAVGLAEKQVEKILKVELKPETQNAVVILLQTFPSLGR